MHILIVDDSQYHKMDYTDKIFCTYIYYSFLSHKSICNYRLACYISLGYVG